MNDYKLIQSERGKSIYVFDDIFEHDWRRRAYSFAIDSKYIIGWSDIPEIKYSEYQYLHCKLNPNDVDNFGIIQEIFKSKNEKLKSILKNKNIGQCAFNLSTPSDTYFTHTHAGTTLLYYANPDWNEHWYGETIFYDNGVNEIFFSTKYKPGRLLLFDGAIPHSIRPQSSAAPNYRITFACFFDEGLLL